MIESEFNKEILKDFIKWYKYSLSINEFFRLPNDMKLGIYINYIQDKGYYVLTTYKGSVIIDNKLTIVDVIEYDKTDIIDAYYKAIKQVFELINQPKVPF